MTAVIAGLLIVATSRAPGFTAFGVLLIILGGLWTLLAQKERA